MASGTESASPPAVTQLGELEKSSPQFRRQLKSVLYVNKTDWANFVASLNEDDALSFIDILDEALDAIPPSSDLYRKIRRALRKICGEKRILPSAHKLPDGLKITGDGPVASGGFADIWKGTYQGREVAIKVLRIQNDNFQRVKKVYCKEVLVWRRLSHENVLTFLGVSSVISPLEMVSEWMSNGNISEYIKAHPKADRIKLLLDVANGIQYLHKEQVVHGDLKGLNILINESGRACLADFGIASITRDPDSVNASTGRDGHCSARWTAPELLDPDQYNQEVDRVTKESDIYALAMVIVEVMSGRVPYPAYKNEAVILKIMEERRPERPTHPDMSDELWETVQGCWCADKTMRLKVEDVINCLERALDGRKTEPCATLVSNTPVSVVTQEPIPKPQPQVRSTIDQFYADSAIKSGLTESETSDRPLGWMERFYTAFRCLPQTSYPA